MLPINDLDQFVNMKNNAVRNKRLRKTNFLLSDKEMSLHIANNRVFYEETEKCLCVVVKTQGTDHLYFWCGDKNDVFLPAEATNVFFNVFTNERMKDEWSEAAEKLNLTLKSRIYQVTRETKKLAEIRYPSWLDDDYDLIFKENCSYEYYTSLVQPYCEFLDNPIEEKYIWDGLMKDKTVIAEVRAKNGELAAFHVYTHNNKIMEGHLVAVDAKYRGIGLVNFIKKNIMLCKTFSDCKYTKGWIHDWNKNSWRIHEKIGCDISGNYQAVYGN